MFSLIFLTSSDVDTSGKLSFIFDYLLKSKTVNTPTNRTTTLIVCSVLIRRLIDDLSVENMTPDISTYGMSLYFSILPSYNTQPDWNQRDVYGVYYEEKFEDTKG